MSFKKFFLFKIIYFFFNIIILLLNCFALLFYRFKKFDIIIFKSTDLFNLNLYKNVYNNISKYLNNKFLVSIPNNNVNIKQKKSNIKKVIKIAGTGLWDKKRDLKWLASKLDNEFILRLDDKKPDYLLYNVYNDKDMNPEYNNAIKIAFYTENIIPDINYADYAIGQYHITI